MKRQHVHPARRAPLSCGAVLQRKTVPAGRASGRDYAAAERSAVPAVVGGVLRSPSQPLDGRTRAFMEPRFGHDFSGVRVHAGAAAAESARAVDALAYTVGREVVFGAGQYAPQTPRGRSLLAHELTHVVQQRAAASPESLSLGPSGDAHERAAERQAERVAGGGRAENVAGARPGVLQRQSPEAPKKPADGKVVVTQPPPQKIAAPKPPAAEKPPGGEEKKGVEGAVSLAAETETKTEDGKTSTEFAGKYKLEVTIPITDKLQIGRLSFFKELGIEASGGVHSSSGPKSPLTAVELQAAVKLVSLDFEKVKVPFGLLDLGLSGSLQGSGEYSPMESKGTAKFGLAGEGEAKYKRTEKSPFFIKLNVGVEKTYDKEGKANFKWSPAVWKTSVGVGLEF